MAEEDPEFRRQRLKLTRQLTPEQASAAVARYTPAPLVAPTGAYVAPSNTYLTPNGSPVTPPPPAPPAQPSMRARALAEILSQTRYTVADSGPNQGDESTLLPKFYANRNAMNTNRYGGDYTPSERFNVEVRPEDNDGEYLYNLMHKLGSGVAQQYATGGSPGDSDEDMMARDMTGFMRNYKNYVPEDDLALALAEIYATNPGAAPRQTDSRGHPGQEDAENRGLGGVAYNNMTPDQVADAMVNGTMVGMPGVTTPGYGPDSNMGGAKPKYGDRLGGFKDVAKFAGVVPLGYQIFKSIMDPGYNAVGGYGGLGGSPFSDHGATYDAYGRTISDDTSDGGPGARGSSTTSGHGGGPA